MRNILAGQTSVDIAALAHAIPQAEIEGWVATALAGMEAALSDAQPPAGSEDRLQALSAICENAVKDITLMRQDMMQDARTCP